MNAMSSSFDPSVEEQAALWAARLDGSNLSGHDKAELESWLAADPAHRSALAQFVDLSAELDQALPALVQARLVPMVDTPHRARRGWGFLVATGSVIAGAAALAVALFIGSPTREVKDVATPIAQRQSITLADGTRIDLNARTSVHVNLGHHERQVRLSGGEAFFAVSKDKSRPFTVDTAAGSVRVTGTAFNVRTTGDSGLQVTVVEGSVEVRPSHTNAPVQLGAGQRLTSGTTGFDVQAMSGKAIDDALAWRHGKIVCVDLPLRDVLAELARFHGRTITVSADAGAKRIGGTLGLDDLNAALAALQDSFQVQIAPQADGTLHVRGASEH